MNCSGGDKALGDEAGKPTAGLVWQRERLGNSIVELELTVVGDLRDDRVMNQQLGADRGFSLDIQTPSLVLQDYMV